MKLLHLVDLAATIACYGRSLVCDQRFLNEDAVTGCWSTARERLDAWEFDYSIYARAARREQCELSPRLCRLVLEIEASQVANRTIAALFAAHDAYHGRSNYVTIGNNLVVNNTAMSDRMHHLLGETKASHESLLAVAKLRSCTQKLHKLSDTLVGGFAAFADIRPFAYDPLAAQEAGEASAARIAEGHEPLDAKDMSLILAALARTVQQKVINVDLNKSFAEHVLGFFGPELFDSVGLLRATWLTRMQHTADEAEALIDQWQMLESPAGGKSA